MVPALYFLFRFVVSERIGTIILSAIVAHTAWHWTGERWERLRQFAWPAFDAHRSRLLHEGDGARGRGCRRVDHLRCAGAAPQPGAHRGRSSRARRVKPIPQDLVERLYRSAGADRWSVPVERFAAALQASADRAGAVDVGAYLKGLHLEDLALACACTVGDEQAWEHFVREHRPVLYRAADALRPGGGARDLADALYADLYGLQELDGERRSLFRYFHGRSSLATWLRAVLAQRVVTRSVSSGGSIRCPMRTAR